MSGARAGVATGVGHAACEKAQIARVARADESARRARCCARATRADIVLGRPPARARVESSIFGVTTATTSPSRHGQAHEIKRVDRADEDESAQERRRRRCRRGGRRRRPPASRHGPTSSAFRSGEPMRRLTAYAAAGGARRWLPSPEPIGIPFCEGQRNARRRRPPSRASPRPRSPPCSSPDRAGARRRRRSPASIVTPRPRASRAVTRSPGAASASPSTSSPGPRFATVAGAKAVIAAGAAHLRPPFARRCGGCRPARPSP